MVCKDNRDGYSAGEIVKIARSKVNSRLGKIENLGYLANGTFGGTFAVYLNIAGTI
jgi:hypothetical protein